jgi:hypothetical protein
MTMERRGDGDALAGDRAGVRTAPAPALPASAGVLGYLGTGFPV